MRSPFRDSLDAILLGCGGWFLFSVCDALSKWLTVRYPAQELLAINCTIGMFLSAAWIFYRHGWKGFQTSKLKWYILRGCSQAGSSYFVIKALATIPLSDMYGIIFLTPMLITIMAVLFLGEKIAWPRIMAIILGFCGVLVIAGPSSHHHGAGYAMTLVAAVFASLSGIFVRKIGREAVPLRYTLYPYMVASVIFVGMSLLTGGFTVPQPLDLGLIALYAPVSLIGLVLYSMAFARAPEAAIVAPFHYTQMIWGVLFGYVVFHNLPALSTMAGSALIVGAGIVVILRERAVHRQIATLAAETTV